MLFVTRIESCVVCDEYRNLVLSVASIVIFVMFGEYSLVLSEPSIEFCVISDECRKLVLSVASIEIFVLSVASIEILCCV